MTISARIQHSTLELAPAYLIAAEVKLGDTPASRTACRLIVVGGHTRNIGKTQLVCDLIAALPSAHWIAGKITQYGHGVCATNGHDCDCAPTEHMVALDWETGGANATDSGRFLSAGAARSFWLRTKQGFLAEGMPVLRDALAEADGAVSGGGMNVIIESNSVMRFVKPSLFVSVFDAERQDFKESARQILDRADVLVFRRGSEDGSVERPPWPTIPLRVWQQRPPLLQREGEALPEALYEMVQRILDRPATVLL